MKSNERIVFVSHAVEDIGLAGKFVDMLQNGIGLSQSEVFYTSKPGQGVAVGDNFVQSIRENLANSEISIALITYSFYESSFCMCELGAIWGASKQFIPVLCPPIDYSGMNAVLSGLQAVRANTKSDLDIIYDTISQHMNRPNSVAAWNEKATSFIEDLPTFYSGPIVKKSAGINFLNNDIFQMARALNSRTMGSGTGKTRTQKQCFLIAFDIDGMSQINKMFGYGNGERLIDYITDNVNNNEKLTYLKGGRCGHDTFYALFLGTEKQAIAQCREFLDLVANVPERLKINMQAAASGAVSTFTSAIDIADVKTSVFHALKKARKSGGNVVATGEEPNPDLPHEWVS